ncbi:SH3 domain-containing protein [Sphingomonas sp. KR1UV-12]|uniref:SH3 domain-containing protein n=1 Tax=Sphingomonas aurea TaxID=3063994 RepID=A0ABT9EFZ8_9SPHN|nr:SH3 domain-containing protein [Sphingomonas sp. KR1UV-12]MDP1025893.1 SH3 domain-containing protein [Sphingomonas sp. KR1UV-12]
MRIASLVLFTLLAVGTAGPVAPAVAQDAAPQPPRWMSIGAGRALMRTGPARTYPGAWLYQRPDLPLRVTAAFQEWRRVQDPDGTEGWMLVNLLRKTRTAYVRGPGAAAMRDKPSAGSGAAWHAAPGVVGRISACGEGWCRFDVKGKAGFVEVGDLWGVDPGEVLP